MIRKMILMLGCVLLFGVSSALGQFVQDSLDLGVPDTIDVEFSVIPDDATNQLHLQMDLYFFNDSNNVATAGVGFEWDNPNLMLDSADATLVGRRAFNYVRVFYRNDDIDSTNFYRQCQFSGARRSGDGLVASDERKHIASYFFTLSQWSASDSIVIDTVQFSIGSKMSFVMMDYSEYIPYWTGKKVVHDTSYVGPSNLGLSEDTLFFDYTIGSGTPSPQTFDITSDNEMLSFTLSEDASWLLRSPSTGFTPKTITVSVVTVGLTAGHYFDSIMVSSPGASNSPQFVYVDFVVSEPPPVIDISPGAFTFNAIVDGDNPAPQVMHISNSGQSTLNWTVSNSQSWLDLAPLSGTEDGDVTLSVDITGLGYGDYYDTVWVSDPNATNDPVPAEVRLSILSSLPLIDVDSVYYFVFALSEGPQYQRSIEVRNGGGGILDFWIKEKLSPQVTLPKIIDFDPDTSQADTFVTITWEGFSIPNGRTTADTVLVYSNDAVNSPQMVVLNLRFVDNPAEIALSTDTLDVDVYECSQGYGNPMPTATFTVSNTGGDNPMNIDLAYESTLFTVSDSDGIAAPHTYTVTALVEDLPVGTYYDTVTVSSMWAMNGSQDLIVRYNIIPADVTPEIFVERTNFVIPYRDGTGPLSDDGITIFNVHGGCMPWSISEDIDWLIPSDTLGDVVGDVGFVIIPQGMTIGEYVDTLTITVPGASNSPYQIEVTLQLWLLVGDWDWDGQVSLGDLTLMINYLFVNPGEIPPLPILEAGNTDCEEEAVVSLGDLVKLIDYLFISLTPLCGNPF